MQIDFLNFLMIGVLVLLFASIYGKRPSGQLRFWIIGWLCILGHFACSSVKWPEGSWRSTGDAINVGLLVIAGVFFLFSGSRGLTRRPALVLRAALLCVPALAYIALDSFHVRSALLLYAVGGAAQLTSLLAAFFFRRRFPWTFSAALLSFPLALAATAYGIHSGQSDLGVIALLTQVFLFNAALFWDRARRPSAGVMTASLALLAWAAVFPAGEIMFRFLPHVQVHPDLWNVPKYFVAFGMLLSLLEQEIVAVGRASEEYRLLFASNPEPMCIFDPDTLRFLQVNDAALALYGYTREEFLARSLPDLHPLSDWSDLLDDAALARRRPAGFFEHLRKDGTPVLVEINAHTIGFRDIPARLLMVADVTEQQALHERLLHQVHHDILTGLPNRLLLLDRLQQAVQQAQRSGRKAAVLSFDLDRFRHVNETFGHTVGDSTLRSLANLLSTRVRPTDTVARSGGGEFTLVLGEIGDASEAERVARDVLAALRQPLHQEGYQVSLTASMGVALYPDDGIDPGELWRSADSAMYTAKQAGGDHYVLVSRERHGAASEAGELEIYMRRALQDGGFEVHYQPQFTMDRQFAGVEALLRLRHPTIGMVSPDRFIPIAESSGLITQIGPWVLEEVCRQSASWRQQGIKPIHVAVNVSPLQFMRADFLRQVLEILKCFQMDPRLLELEVTETTVMRNLDDVARQMKSLATLGIQFAIDDFGTGYSSLGHLHALPIATLKIDRSFVDRIGETAGTYSIVQAIISLAHSLRLRVIAEGVEREDQMRVLRDLRCDLVQGFLFAGPMQASAIPALLSDPEPSLPTRRRA